MRVQLDKISSATRNVPLHRQVVLGSEIPATAGTVLAVRVLDEKSAYNQVEDVHGRMMTVHAGDLLAGVLGARRALRGYSGEVPERVAPGDVLHLLNLGGIIGRCTSANPEVGPPARVEVLGVVLRFPELGRRVGAPANIRPGPVTPTDTLDALPPAIFVVGSCMHAGKTAAACQLVRKLTAAGLRVGVAKVTGVALRRDALEMVDHGAVCAYTFADAGLPSTCEGEVVAVARGCLNAVAQHKVDVMVIELGDGLLGDYGVMDILEAPDLAEAATATVLAATDPVAAWGGVGLLAGIGMAPTVVTGPSTDNEAGSSRITAMTEIPALNARTQSAAFAEAVFAQLRGKAPKRTALRIAGGKP